MKKLNDLSKSLAPFYPDTSLVVVVELSQSSWLVAGRAASLDRQPIKKLEPDENALLSLLHRWRDEASGKGLKIAYCARLRGRSRRILVSSVAEAERN